MVRRKVGKTKKLFEPIEPTKREMKTMFQVGHSFWPSKEAYLTAMKKSVASIMAKKNVSRTEALQTFHKAIGAGPQTGKPAQIILGAADAFKLRMKPLPLPRNPKP